jgi:hypothetical protein
VDRGTRFRAASESEVIFGVELVDGPVARKGGGVLRQRLRHLILGVQGRVDTTLTLRGSDEALVSALGILTLVDGERVIARLGEGIDFGAPAVSAVGPARDRLAFLGSELVEMSERRPLRLLLAQVGLDPLSGHHDAGLVLLRDVDLRPRLLAKKGRTRWEGWEVVEWGKERMAAVGVGELDRGVGRTRRVALGVL